MYYTNDFKEFFFFFVCSCDLIKLVRKNFHTFSHYYGEWKFDDIIYAHSNSSCEEYLKFISRNSIAYFV